MPRVAHICLVLAIILASCGNNHKGGGSVMDLKDVKEELELLRGKRIFFGHQSVGTNIMAGVKDLEMLSHAETLNFVSVGGNVRPRGSFLGDGIIGRNTDPASKCDAFSAIVRQLGADSLDIAMMKFCYVDIDAKTDVDAMFKCYTTSMDSLKHEFPRVHFIHVTVPLTQVSSPWKRMVKRILGRSGHSDADNLRRLEFNEKLVNRYSGEHVFDLAKAESTFPDGSRCTFEFEGTTGFSMVKEYTDDGGHLNKFGRRIVAREFVHALVGAVKQ